MSHKVLVWYGNGQYDIRVRKDVEYHFRMETNEALVLYKGDSFDRNYYILYEGNKMTAISFANAIKLLFKGVNCVRSIVDRE